MSQIDPLVVVERLLGEIKSNYEAVNQSGLSFERERLYMLEQARKVDRESRKMPLAEAAVRSPVAFKSAVLHQAAIGLSFNPALSLAYLVVRGGEAVLDVPYQGLIKLATDGGAIEWAKAELIYSKDKFQYRGPAEIPRHEPDILGADRGELRGVYCIAKTGKGDFLTEVLSVADIENIRACSRARGGPWKTFPGEMAKKAAIKRASKTWPRTPHDNRLMEAIRVLNEHEGGYESAQTAEDGSADPVAPTPPAENLPAEGLPPYDVAAIPEDIKQGVAKLIARVSAGRTFAVARDYVEDSQSLTSEQRRYALDEIAKAEAATKAA